MKYTRLIFLLALAVSCTDKSFERASGVLPEPDGYKLEQVVVLSRHNIRTPLVAPGSVLDSITPHRDCWRKWQGAPGELTASGASTELKMGQYFGAWLVSEGLVPENWQPSPGQIRFYANSFQRTIATARSFAAGLVPLADVKVEHKQAARQDLVFLPILTSVSEEFHAKAMEERAEQGGEGGLKALIDSLKPAFSLLEEVLDFENSEYYRTHGTHFGADSLVIVDIEGDEPRIRSSFAVACSASDALLLQLYEEQDDAKAGFGHVLSVEEWRRIVSIKDTYLELLFAPPTVSRQTSALMLKELKKELGKSKRVFSFLCGHDSTLTGLITALGVENFQLPASLERLTPISSKLVFEKYSRGGELFARLRIVYPGWEQLRGTVPLGPDAPPQSVYLSLKGLAANSDGYYRYEDLISRMDNSN